MAFSLKQIQQIESIFNQLNKKNLNWKIVQKIPSVKERNTLYFLQTSINPKKFELYHTDKDGDFAKFNTYTIEKVDEFISQLYEDIEDIRIATISGNNGFIYPSTVMPNGGWKVGFYEAGEEGVYSNIGMGAIDLNSKIVRFYYDGTVWSKVEVEVSTEKLEKEISDLEDSLFEKSKPYVLSSSISGGSFVAVLLGNNVPSDKTGTISKIRFLSEIDGVAKFQILERKTFNATDPGTVDTFASIKTFLVEDVKVGWGIYTVDQEIKEGQYLVQVPNNGVNPAFTTLGTPLGWWQGTAGEISGTQDLVYQPYSVLFEYEVSNSKFKKEISALENNLFEKSKPYALTTDTLVDFVPVLLGNNKPAHKSGLISKIRFIANIDGDAKFQILERKTFNATANGQQDLFLSIKTFIVENVKQGWGTYPVSEEIKEGQFLMQVPNNGLNPAYTTSGTPLGWWQGGAEVNGTEALTRQGNTILFEYEILSFKFNSFDSSDVQVVEIEAVKNPENYNSIRNLVNNINDASEKKQYVIKVGKGTWNEIDWKGKKWVKIVGDINGETIINLDPLGTMSSFIAPADYFFASEAGKPLNSLPQYTRHIVFALDDIHCENLTFKAKDSKYSIHLDNPGYKKAYFKNCRIIEENCNHAVGMGINGGQEVMFESCVLKSIDGNKYGFFYHNWNNQTKENTVTFNKCKFDNCLYGNIDELGSEQCSFVNVWNCFATGGAAFEKFNFMVDMTSDNKTYWKRQDGTNEPNPVNVPYCIVLNTSGTKVSGLTVSDSGTFNPSWNGIPQRDIVKIKELSIINVQ